MNRDIWMRMPDFTAGYECDFWWLRLPVLVKIFWKQQVRVNEKGGALPFV